MHFDPIIRPHGSPQSVKPIDAGDCDLPRDLIALGKQLRDDSAWLATCYPVNVSAVGNLVVPAPAPRPWVRIAAAILVLTAGIGIAIRTQPSVALPGRVADDNLARTRQPVLRQPPATALTDRVLDAGEAYLRAADANATAGLIVPAVLFHNLSGPEQEGLLDLLDEIIPEAIDLSM